jgi:predicted ATPase
MLTQDTATQAESQDEPKPTLYLESCRIKNFKAIRDSGEIKFTPLTVFIGGNGVGKSSVIEGLEFLQSLAFSNLDETLQEWGEYKNILNQAVPHLAERPSQLGQRRQNANPISLEIQGKSNLAGYYKSHTEIASDPGETEVFLSYEYAEYHDLSINLNVTLIRHGDFVEKDAMPNVNDENVKGVYDTFEILSSESILSLPEMKKQLRSWQFLSLVPEKMKWSFAAMSNNSMPNNRKKDFGGLRKDGSNLASFLRSIERRNNKSFLNIIDNLQTILQYAQDLHFGKLNQPEQEKVILRMVEADRVKFSDVTFSSGTLRLIALLAVLLDPKPAPLIVIEEIENGLDPNTINLILEKIHSLIESGKSQVILTTHSPYLLDQLSLSQIILVERDETGSPTFRRPADQPGLENWAKRFAPGSLYTMGRFRQHKEK